MTREDAQPTGDGGSRKRRRLLLWLSAMLVVAVVAWVAVLEMRYRRRQHVIEMIESEGGTAWTHSVAPDLLLRLTSDDYDDAWLVSRVGPNWLRSALPTDRFLGYFETAGQFALVDIAPPDLASDAKIDFDEARADLAPGDGSDSGSCKIVQTQLVCFPHLQRLWLGRAEIDSSSLDGLQVFRDLQWLSLFGTSVSDDGLLHVSELSNLEQLILVDLDIGDAGVRHLANLKKLRLLDLRGTNVGDAGLTALEELKNLQVLDLSGTNVRGTQLAALARLRALTVLDLDGTEVGDEDVAKLGTLRRLKTLDLGGTNVSNAVLLELKGLSDLESLDVSGTRVTVAGLEALRGATSLRRLRFGPRQTNDPQIEHQLDALRQMFPSARVTPAWGRKSGSRLYWNTLGDLDDPGFLDDGMLFEAEAGGWRNLWAGKGPGGIPGGVSRMRYFNGDDFLRRDELLEFMQDEANREASEDVPEN